MASENSTSTAAPSLAQILDEMAAAKAILSGIQNLLGPAPEPDEISAQTMADDVLQTIAARLTALAGLATKLAQYEEDNGESEDCHIFWAFSYALEHEVAAIDAVVAKGGAS